MINSLARLINMQKYLYSDLYKLEEVHWWHRAKRELVGFFLKKYLPNQNNKILDVGCGTGKNLEAFSKFGQVWGIDNSLDAIAFCKKRGFKNVTLGNIEKKPYGRGSFDAVTALDVLEHVDDSKALKEINRILNQEGVLIVTVPAFEWLWSKWDEVLHHKRRYTEKTLKRILKNNGFKIIRISYAYSFLTLPALVVRNIKKIFYKDYYPSDFQLNGKMINNIFNTLASIERIFIINFKIPFGTSLVAVTKKINK